MRSCAIMKGNDQNRQCRRRAPTPSHHPFPLPILVVNFHYRAATHGERLPLLIVNVYYRGDTARQALSEFVQFLQARLTFRSSVVSTASTTRQAAATRNVRGALIC
jgi:hypothetical protein